MDPAAVSERASALPSGPDVYQLAAGDAVLYVGRAVDIRARVRSCADPHSERISRMIDHMEHVDLAVTDTEMQALLLEANLIKCHQPRYNIRLKDNKSYPLIQLMAHAVPRTEVTHDPEDSTTVFGPYTDKNHVKTVVKAIRGTYGLRGCPGHKYSNRSWPCLDHEMGLCTTPCIGEIAEYDYREGAEPTVRFSEGETGVLADPLRRGMEVAAQDAEFRRATNLRGRLEAVGSFHGVGEDTVSSQFDKRVIGILGASFRGDSATVTRLHTEHGQLVGRTRRRLDVPEGENRIATVLSAFLAQLCVRHDLPDTVVLSEHPDDEDVVAWLRAKGVGVRIPGTGREVKLVELTLKSAHRRAGCGDGLATLAREPNPDMHRVTRIEGFDVSHAQGKTIVGSDVYFVEGGAEATDYRQRRLPECNGDYADMHDLVRQRTTRALEGYDDRPDPDLLLIDGDKGQLNAALDASDEMGWDVSTVGIAKDRELVATPNRTFNQPGDAPHLHVLQRARDEAHHFAVQYHQTLRDEMKTVFNDVPGVGEKTRQALLTRFDSVEGVREASVEDLIDVPGVDEKTADELKRRL